MTSNPPLSSPTESPAELLRRLATRAYRALRVAPTEDRDELRDLLDQIDHARRVFSPLSGDELTEWLDRLEGQVAERLESTKTVPSRIRPSACCGGVGVA